MASKRFEQTIRCFIASLLSCHLKSAPQRIHTHSSKRKPALILWVKHAALDIFCRTWNKTHCQEHICCVQCINPDKTLCRLILRMLLQLESQHAQGPWLRSKASAWYAEVPRFIPQHFQSEEPGSTSSEKPQSESLGESQPVSANNTDLDGPRG